MDTKENTNGVEKKHGDIYQMITDMICEKLEQGEIPWRKPWAGGGFQRPCNMESGKGYNGINILMLGLQGYTSKFWVTYRQARKLGGHIRKGEKATPVIFWKWMKKEVENAQGVKEEKEFPILRYYNVFNLQQVAGIEIPDEPEPQIDEFNPIDEAERIIRGVPFPPTIRHMEARAYYDPTIDKVNLPRKELFNSEEEYYSTFFHELVHSTGHEHRLNRAGITEIISFGSHEYSKEELVAEIGSCFLSNEAGILPSILDNSSAYIQGWLKRLRDNRKWIIVASAQAQKAADYIVRRDEGV